MKLFKSAVLLAVCYLTQPPTSHSWGDKVGPEEEHRVAGLEIRSDAMPGPCGSDGGDPDPKVSACVQASFQLGVRRDGRMM